ncbi:LysR family transcriptional regulator [Vibrio coralliilyticus]|uniref:LysR family transcriptional regulator n=1 Tax=Vibrio coralliilyticus TaxID=190893 RepID=UPI000BAC1EBC|nr:LysR family transcriptional regulator [Vibrio coralliilyticus]NOI75868.1 LysR family transcriptional regulator [Vibrio coralliilyticus]PAW04085.1 transcriptional regulator [Vibrio coralliilyticus]
MFNIPNLRHLRAISEVVQTGSISKASETVFLSQPAITQAISKLEKNINSELFERTTDGMSPTKQGSAFAFRIDRALEYISDGITESLKIAKGQRKTSVQRYLYNITTTQLKALVAVANGQSFTEASRLLSVSQSSVYRASKDLEEILGFTLFEKNSNGVVVSKAGSALVKASKLAFVEIKQGIEEVNVLSNRHSGVITVGCLPLARTCLLPSTINEFTAEYPDCQIQVVDGPYSDLLNHLKYGEIDILIGALRFPSPSTDIRQETLFESQNRILARAEHPLTKAQSLTLKDLHDASWVVSGANTPGRKMFEDMFSNEGIEAPTRLVEASSQMLVKELLLGSDRLTLLSQHQIHRELNEGHFKILPFDCSQQSRPIGLTVRKNWFATSTQSHFVSLLRKNGLAIES